ncbi:hypothetical protein [Solibacillus sp. CAU 1738]|uniref:hypothetical protein n=1 Tax=Solibacillus sp. CAU 1738 TaxID=3140363 RepID=UPI003260E480
MDENQYLRTMIETVKYVDFNRKEELIGILNNSIVTFDKSNSFTTKSWQFWGYIDLRVPIPMFSVAKELKSDLEKVASMVYMESESYDFGGLFIKPKPIELNNEVVEHDVVFDGIKDTIIQGIREAKYTIWIAVAWFTDNEIYNEL